MRETNVLININHIIGSISVAAAAFIIVIVIF